MKIQSSSFLRTGTGDLENCPCEKYRLGTNGLKYKNHKWFTFRPRYIHTGQKTGPKISCVSPFKNPAGTKVST
jgi:hypothetical protein